MYNIFLACDPNYYVKWGEACIKSIQHFNPWLSITVIIINDTGIKKIPNVRYVYDYGPNTVAYMQAVRFLKCHEIFQDKKYIMSIDCDTLCTKSFSVESFIALTENVSVLKHHKENRWMAGLVTYGDINFRKQFKEKLLELPLDDWEYGWDQTVLNQLEKEFKFKEVQSTDWMSFGKESGIFLTLKGDQKTTLKYLKNYNKIMEKINVQ
jgi:lipopolysaccharide biosynthesis glycosyltransferase